MTLFLTVVLDLFSRQVVDWSMKSHMTTDNELARCLENPGGFKPPLKQAEHRVVNLQKLMSL